MPGAVPGVIPSPGKSQALRALAGLLPRPARVLLLWVCPVALLLPCSLHAAELPDNLADNLAGDLAGDLRSRQAARASRDLAPDPARPPAEGDLSRARLAYERGDYVAVIRLLRPLLYPTVLLPDEEQVITAHKLLGLSHFLEHDEAGAEGEFTLLLSMLPDFALDPLVEPGKAVAFLDNIRQRNHQRLDELRRRQAGEESRRQAQEQEQRKRTAALLREQAPRIYIEKLVRKPIGPLLFVPFGVPQLFAGRRLPGALLLGGEVLSGAASLSAWLTVRFKYPGGTFPPGDLGTAQALTATYLAGGVLFWSLIITGLADALIHAKTVVEIHELPGPPKELSRPAKGRPISELRLLPLGELSAWPGLVGLPGATMPTPLPLWGAALGGRF